MDWFPQLMVHNCFDKIFKIAKTNFCAYRMSFLNLNQYWSLTNTHIYTLF